MDEYEDKVNFWLGHLQTLPGPDLDPRYDLNGGWKSAFNKAFSILQSEWQRLSSLPSLKEPKTNQDNEKSPLSAAAIDYETKPTVFNKIEARSLSNPAEKLMDRTRSRMRLAFYIGQLYYHYYIRTGSKNYLSEAASFLRASMPRHYNFETGIYSSDEAEKLCITLATVNLFQSQRCNPRLIDLVPESLGALIQTFGSFEIQTSTIEFKSTIRCCVMITDTKLRPRHAELTLGTILLNNHLDSCSPPITRAYLTASDYSQIICSLSVCSLRFKDRLVLYYCGEVLIHDELPALCVRDPLKNMITITDILTIRPAPRSTVVLIDSETDGASKVEFVDGPVKYIVGYSSSCSLIASLIGDRPETETIGFSDQFRSSRTSPRHTKDIVSIIRNVVHGSI